MYVPRTLEGFFAASAEHFPVLLLTGARQVGKTTLLRHLSGEKRTFVTLDDPLVLELAKDDPALFFQRYTPPLLIDEIQYAPELLPYIKMAVDKDRRPGAFWLTGSQYFHLMRNISESLAGRAGIVQMLGLSRLESAGRAADSRPFVPLPELVLERARAEAPLSLKEVYRLIWRGSFPAVALHEAVDRDLFYSSYVQTYLQRDVRDLAKVGDEMAFLRFLRTAAARTAQLLNIAELGRDAGVSTGTAKSWLSILQASGIVYLLEPYFSNVTKRLVKTPKLYLLDTGLCAYLTEWSSPETLEAGAMSGAVLETWAVGELLKGWWHSGKRAPFYFYRDKDQKEIDLLIVQDGTAYPIEIKKTASPGSRDIRHFGVLDRLSLRAGPGALVCLVQEALPLTDSVYAVPAGAI